MTIAKQHMVKVLEANNIKYRALKDSPKQDGVFVYPADPRFSAHWVSNDDITDSEFINFVLEDLV